MPAPPTTTTYRWRGRNHKIANGDNKYIIDSLLALATEASDRPRLYDAFALAAASLSKYPLPIRSAEEAGDLVGIGDFIAHRIGHIIRTAAAAAAAIPPAAAAPVAAAPVGRTQQRDSQQRQQRHSGTDAVVGGRKEGGGGGGGVNRRLDVNVSDSSANPINATTAATSSASSSPASSSSDAKKRYQPKEGSTASQLLVALLAAISATASPSGDGESESASASASASVSVGVGAVLEQAALLFDGDNVTTKRENVRTALKKLVDEGLLIRQRGEGDKDEQLSITHVGAIIAKEIDEKRRNKAARAPNAAGSSNGHTAQPSSSASPSSSTSPPPSTSAASATPPPLNVVLPFCQFTLHLVIDNRERRFHSHHQLPPASLVRSLPAGDFVWLLRHVASGTEYCVDLIAERKRVSDLVMSVKDGRMKEQRWRMKRSAMTRKIYIIEGDMPTPAAAAAATSKASEAAVEATPTRHYSIPLSTLESVISSLSVVHGYSVFRTGGVSWTAALLAQLHRQLLSELQEDGVRLTEEYTHFEERMKKRAGQGGAVRALGEGAEGRGAEDGADGGECSTDVEGLRVWGSQLRMIRGISPMIAAGIAQHYPSLARLQQAYSECVSRAEEEALLADIVCGQRSTRLGHPLSRRVREVFRLNTYEASEWEAVAADRDSEEAQARRDAERRRKARKEEQQSVAAAASGKRKRTGVAGRSTGSNGADREGDEEKRQPREKRPRQQQQRHEEDERENEHEHKDEACEGTRKKATKRQEEPAARHTDEAELAAAAAAAAAQDKRPMDKQQQQQHQQRKEAEAANKSEQDAADARVLRELRERVARLESKGRERKEQAVEVEVEEEVEAEAVVALESAAVAQGSQAAIRKLTAKQRLRQREQRQQQRVVERDTPPRAKRSRPRRGVIEVSSGDEEDERKEDGGHSAKKGSGSVEVTDDDDEVMCVM